MEQALFLHPGAYMGQMRTEVCNEISRKLAAKMDETSYRCR